MLHWMHLIYSIVRRTLCLGQSFTGSNARELVIFYFAPPYSRALIRIYCREIISISSVWLSSKSTALEYDGYASVLSRVGKYPLYLSRPPTHPLVPILLTLSRYDIALPLFGEHLIRYIPRRPTKQLSLQPRRCGIMNIAQYKLIHQSPSATFHEY